MKDQIDLQRKVVEKLSGVIDPETGVDVIRMRLVQDISIDKTGMVTYIFRPSSPLCPIAVPLALNIMQAIADIPGITNQDIKVVDYIQAEQLNETLKSLLKKIWGDKP